MEVRRPQTDICLRKDLGDRPDWLDIRRKISYPFISAVLISLHRHIRFARTAPSFILRGPKPLSLCPSALPLVSTPHLPTPQISPRIWPKCIWNAHKKDFFRIVSLNSVVNIISCLYYSCHPDTVSHGISSLSVLVLHIVLSPTSTRHPVTLPQMVADKT